MSLADDLKKWRGIRGQKEVNDIFGVSLGTYRAWEQGVNEPTELAQRQIRFVMQCESNGISPEVLTQHYWRVIKQVAAEIEERK